MKFYSQMISKKDNEIHVDDTIIHMGKCLTVVMVTWDEIVAYDSNSGTEFHFATYLKRREEDLRNLWCLAHEEMSAAQSQLVKYQRIFEQAKKTYDKALEQLIKIDTLKRGI